ncbi:MAG: sigma-54-dependent Fis family transcriptional regulator [Deltaproteobacteria bacterium]|nr:sigma-54-dependent Fis family transcriptional regulator [Deltaproteobacteria bacterium]
MKRLPPQWEETAKTLFRLAGDSICIVDRQGCVILANDSMGALLGYAPLELQGRPLLSLLAQDCSASWEDVLHGMSGEKPYRSELILARKDGGHVSTFVTVASLQNSGDPSDCIVLMRDATPLRKREEDLLEARNFCGEIINIMSDNLLVIDPRDYRIIQANQPLVHRLGLENISSVLGKPCYEVILGRGRPCQADGLACIVQQAYQTNRPVGMEKGFPDARGQARLFQVIAHPVPSSSGAPHLIIRIERDITEKRRMEETLASRSRELQKTQQQLETLFEISRQMSAKSSIRELVHSLYEIMRRICPECTPLLFLLSPAGNHFLRLETCDASVSQPVVQMLRRMEEAGVVSDFIAYLNRPGSGHLFHSGSSPETPAFLNVLGETFDSWFGLPISTENRCTGLCFMGGSPSKSVSREDIRFLHALFEQVAGHLHKLVIHEAEINQLRSHVQERAAYGEIIGQSKAMQEVYELIGLVSGSDATVLITGENGTGKELVAQAIHSRSHRYKGPFVVANCSAYSPTLLESEIFGHEKGAFTGAIRQKKGRIERANGGTLFLDEIGDTAPATQILLLRFLQDHCFERVGGETTIAADVRILAATNRDLQAEVRAGRFRDDLYYRLNVISIHLPLLRERKEDIPLLAQHFLKKYNLKEGKKILKFSPDAMQVLMDHEWPGNVRQLENAISHAVVLAQEDVIRMSHLPRFLREGSHPVGSMSLEENERQLILRVLNDANWNKHEAARRLRISRSTLYSMIRRYGLGPESQAIN